MSFRPLVLCTYVIFSMFPAYFGLKYFGEVRSFMKRAILTEATISHFNYSDRRRISFSDKAFEQWVRLVHTDGSEISLPTNVTTANDTHRIGEKISVYYDPNAGGIARVNSLASLYLLPGAFLGGAFAIFLFGLFRSRSKRRM